MEDKDNYTQEEFNKDNKYLDKLLIKILVFFSIILILILLVRILPKEIFYGKEYRTSIKYNLFEIQSITNKCYYKENKFPRSINEIKKNKKWYDYLKKLENPITKQQLNVYLLENPPQKDDIYFQDENFKLGDVLYYPYNNYTNFAVYGVDKNGKILRDKGKIYYLTNE